MNCFLFLATLSVIKNYEFRKSYHGRAATRECIHDANNAPERYARGS